MEKNNGSAAKPQDTTHIEEAYDLYLELMALDKRRMPPHQVRETKRAFYGAYGILLTAICIDMKEMSEERASSYLDELMKEISKFMMKEGFDHWGLKDKEI